MNENKNVITDSRLKVSEDVLRAVVLQAIREIKGVHSPEKPHIGLMAFLIKERNVRPVRIDMKSDAIKLDIGLKIKSGYKIKDVAEQVQRNVKSAVQNMTGIMIAKINVYISGVS